MKMKVISTVLLGASLAFTSWAVAQNDPTSPSPPPPTSPQATDASQNNPTGTNGPHENALNLGTAGNQAGLSGNGSMAFESLDKAHLGYLRESDVVANKKLAGNFKSCDMNHDGTLDRDEYNACANLQ